MIKEQCFTEEWFDSFKNQPEFKRIDKIILEKMIYALHLLERIQTNGLDFVFKGGTSLILLLEEGNRFSIDIDIICNSPREEIEAILEKVIDTSRFKAYELDENRSYQPGIPKAHYAFSFDSAINERYSGRILLDILQEKSIYPELIEKEIHTRWIETTEKTRVAVPSIDAITGDKLTAFAPNTIGIPYFKGKQSFSMEICKQLFDLNKLIDKIQNFEVVTSSFTAFVKQEIEYRKAHFKGELTPQIVLQDIIDTCLIITRRGGPSRDDRDKFVELQKGIQAFGTGFLMTGHFRIDEAIAASAKVACIAAKLLKNDLSPVLWYKGQDISNLSINDKNWNFLNRLKRQPDKSIFYYWYQAVGVLGNSI